MYAIGIDPGVHGGVTALDKEGHITFQRPFTDDTARAVLNALPTKSYTQSLREPATVFLEHVHAMPGQGSVSMFNFGKHFGMVLMALESRGFEYRLIAPQTWAKEVNRSKASDAKKRAIETALALWPHNSFVPKGCRKPHGGLVDSALIAECGRRILRGLSVTIKDVGF